jgi:protein-L-isoaspartate O-methyltransferase
MSHIDFIAYPPTSFPYRDLLVLEQLSFNSTDRVCEIGIGSGGTTARLAKRVGSITGFEISAPTVEALRYLEDRYPNLRLVVSDVTQQAHLDGYSSLFSRLIACDTLEHVDTPSAFFHGVSSLLAPGGEFLVTFPNEPPERMHGITRFEKQEDLAALVRQAGFSDFRIGAAKLSPKAGMIAEQLAWKPIKVVRALLSAVRNQRPASVSGKAPPQTFDETNFFKNIGMWQTISPVINAWWFGLLRIMEASGPVFEIDWDFKHQPFRDSQVIIVGKKSSASHSNGVS